LAGEFQRTKAKLGATFHSAAPQRGRKLRGCGQRTVEDQGRRVARSRQQNNERKHHQQRRRRRRQSTLNSRHQYNTRAAPGGTAPAFTRKYVPSSSSQLSQVSKILGLGRHLGAFALVPTLQPPLLCVILGYGVREPQLHLSRT